MKRLWWILVLCAAEVALAQPDAPAVRAVTLKNGLLVLLAPDSQATAADVAVWYRAGTRFEKPGSSGLTYLFGQLMFGGSRSYRAGEHRRLLEAEGATLNLLANPDYVCFYETLPSEAIELALRLEADRMAALTLTREGFDAARREVEDQRRQGLGTGAAARGLQRLYATAFAGHPYSRPVIGLEQDLDRLTFKEAESYYRERFSPDQAVLTVVGRFDTAGTLAAVRRRFEAVPRRAAPSPPEARLPAQSAPRRGSASAVSEGPMLLVGWRGPGDADPNRPAVEALAQIITGGALSRLNRLLAVPNSDFLQANADLDRSKEASLLFCAAAIRAGADTAAAEQALIESIEKLGQEPVSTEELDRARRQIEARMLFGWQTSRGRAEALGMAQLLDGDYRAAATHLDRIRRLTPDDLRRAAAKFLSGAGRSVVWVTPSGATGSSGGSGGGGRRP